MKQTFRGSLNGIHREVTTYQTNNVLTCCRTVGHQYCRMELWAQTGKSPMKQTYEQPIQQRITDKNHSIIIETKTQQNEK